MSATSTIPNIDSAPVLSIFTMKHNLKRDTATAPLSSKASEAMDGLDLRGTLRLRFAMS